MSEPNSIEMSVWVHRPPFIIRRECLPVDDPEHPYNYLENLGVRPEDYGVHFPGEPIDIADPEAMTGEIRKLRRRIAELERDLVL